jgi:hypothetical protein
LPVHGGSGCYKVERFTQVERRFVGILAPLMQAASPSSPNPAGAGGLLLAVLVLGIGAGLLVGWAVGATAIGALAGAVLGVVGGIFAVYRRYGASV